MISLPISQRTYTTLVIFFLMYRAGENDFTPHIAGDVQHPVIFFLISRRKENGITPNITGCVNPFNDIVSIIQGGRG